MGYDWTLYFGVMKLVLGFGMWSNVFGVMGSGWAVYVYRSAITGLAVKIIFVIPSTEIMIEPVWRDLLM